MGRKRSYANASAGSKVSAGEDYDNGRNKNGGGSKTKQGDRSSSSPSPSDDLSVTRQIDHLYVSQETLDCTMSKGCVPCAYKIGCFDVALDKEFCKAAPNQRPEQCPRSRNEDQHQNDRNVGVMGFCRGMSILTVGDGDFSFSLGLARKLMQNSGQNQIKQKGKAKKTFLVATSYESESTLRKVYPDFEATIRELYELGVHVAYNVDATRILETLSLPEKVLTRKLERRFHRICWNFPCTAIASGQDGQNTAMEENKELVRSFVESSRSVLTDKGDGELCICHKTKPPFNQWNLEEVALQNQKTQKNNNGTRDSRLLLCYSGRIVLDRFLLPPYTPRKALDKKSFPCHDACFYIFAQEPTASDHKAAAFTRKKLFLPTIPQENFDREARGGGESAAMPAAATTPSSTNARSNRSLSSSTTLVKIQPELIRLIRQKYMRKNNFGKKRNRNNNYKKKDGFDLSRF